ncbi:unnamed protein product [Aphanomyces euteiches]
MSSTVSPFALMSTLQTSMWLCHPIHLHSFYCAVEIESKSILKPSPQCVVCAKVADGAQLPVATCVSCGAIVHRTCLSAIHEQNTAKEYREHRLVMPVCTTTRRYSSPPPPTPLSPRLSSVELHLLEELSLDPTLPPQSPLHDKNKSLALVYVQRYAPYVAGGILLGGAALFGMPAVALTGLGVGLSGHTYEGISKIVSGRPRSSSSDIAAQDAEWARRICWDLKQSSDIADATYKQDAALLRRIHNNLEASPTAEEVYRMLFNLFASPDELIGRVNTALCAAFRRRAKATTTSLQSLVRDAQVYVGHVLAVTLNTYPALSTTEEGVVMTTEAVEKIVYSDIYPVVFAAFCREYSRHDATLQAHIRNVQAARRRRLSTDPDASLDALASVHYPLGKLQVITEAFRAICTAAEVRLATAPSADTLLPLVVDWIVAGGGHVRHLVAHLAFVSTLTQGGGRGMEGYALTTFHAALRALGATDTAEDETTEEDEEDEEFFDAVEDSPRLKSSSLPLRPC